MIGCVVVGMRLGMIMMIGTVHAHSCDKLWQPVSDPGVEEKKGRVSRFEQICFFISVKILYLSF
jgi:hypothetical protein